MNKKSKRKCWECGHYWRLFECKQPYQGKLCKRCDEFTSARHLRSAPLFLFGPAVVDGGAWSLHQRALDRNLLPSATSPHFCLNGGSSEIKSFSTPYRWRTCCVFSPAEVLNLLSTETARSHPFVFNSEHCCLNCIRSPPTPRCMKDQ